MFDYIEYIDFVEVNCNKYIYKYEIYHLFADGRQVVLNTSVISKQDDVPSICSRAAAIIQAYQEQRMPFVPNLAKFIADTGNPHHLASLKKYLGDYFPDIEYNKYSRCVEKHARRLMESVRK